ncbi:MAG TPA: hypothetical protein VJJ46_09440 [Anaerolineales bacterium]|nr:hypothetical protein [Anaerolineales bacterium]
MRARIVWAAIPAAMLIAACAASPTARPSAPLASAEPDNQAGSSPTPAAAEMHFVVLTPTARRGLEATDPSTVSLGGGSPTLVEFFAFW